MRGAGEGRGKREGGSEFLRTTEVAHVYEKTQVRGGRDDFTKGVVSWNIDVP